MAQKEEVKRLEASPEIATFFKRVTLLPAYLVDFVAAGGSADERIENAAIANEAMEPLLSFFASEDSCPPGCTPNSVTGGCDCDGTGHEGIASVFEARKASTKKEPVATKKKAAKRKKK